MPKLFEELFADFRETYAPEPTTISNDDAQNREKLSKWEHEMKAHHKKETALKEE